MNDTQKFFEKVWIKTSGEGGRGTNCRVSKPFSSRHHKCATDGDDVESGKMETTVSVRRIKAESAARVSCASGARDMDFFLSTLHVPIYLFIYFLQRLIVERRAAGGTARGRPDELRPFTT